MDEQNGPEGHRRVSVVGTGLMGTGIAQVAACRGLRVALHGRSPDKLRQARRSMRDSCRVLVERGKVSVRDAALVDEIELTTGLAAAQHADVVIESVRESLPVKNQLLRELAELCPPEVVLASNTSAIPITALSDGVASPGRVVGVHFFSPVPQSRLCEIIPGELTAKTTVERAVRFAGAMGKSYIVAGRDVAGFITSRLIVGLMLEAARLVEAGVGTVEDVDEACRLAFGHPMGPLAVADLIGVDVVRDTAAVIHEATGEPGFDAPRILRDLVAAGLLGRKSGGGFHKYDASADGEVR